MRENLSDTFESYSIGHRGCVQTTTEGEGVAQMSTLLNNCYLVNKSVYKVGGGQKYPQILSTWFVHAHLSKKRYNYSTLK